MSKLKKIINLKDDELIDMSKISHELGWQVRPEFSAASLLKAGKLL
jgi:hypothetical protein